LRRLTVIRRIFHTIFSFWLAALLLFGVAPKEAVHACAGHQDTVHRRGLHEPVMETAHHHCSFLSFQLMPFAGPAALPVPRETPLPGHESFLPVQNERPAQRTIALRELRGPPAA
jgi:hypothetical protein